MTKIPSARGVLIVFMFYTLIMICSFGYLYEKNYRTPLQRITIKEHRSTHRELLFDNTSSRTNTSSDDVKTDDDVRTNDEKKNDGIKTESEINSNITTTNNELNLNKTSKLELVTKISSAPKEDINKGKTFTTNGIVCPWIPELNKSDYPSTNIIHQLPDKMLKHRKEPRTYPYCNLITPWGLANNQTAEDKYEAPWMLILVKSAAQNILRRNTIRNTWAAIRGVKGRKWFTVFVIAKSGDDEKKQEALVNENKIFGDLLQCDFQDSYANLPLKVLSMMGWLVQSDIKMEFTIFTDDDIVLKIPEIRNFFLAHEATSNESHAYCGFAYSGNQGPIRGRSKWHMGPEIYPGKKYPTFCNGPNYSMTRPLVKQLFCAAAITDYDGFYLEDVLITGIIREKLGNGVNNIHKGGGFVQYFYNQKGGVQNMIQQTWNKWLLSNVALKEIINASDSTLKYMDKSIPNLNQIIEVWGKH